MVNGRQRSDQIGHQTTKFQHLIVTSSKRQHVLAIALAQPLLLYQIREQRSLFLGGRPWKFIEPELSAPTPLQS